MITADMTPMERRSAYLESAVLAKFNASVSLEMAKIWAKESSRYKADANEAFCRCAHYLRLAEMMLETARANHEHAA